MKKSKKLIGNNIITPCSADIWIAGPNPNLYRSF